MPAGPSPPATLTLPAATKRIVPWLVAVAFFMESLDTTILNTAVPTVAAALRIAPLSMKSVLSCYTLSVAVFIPISGWAADRFGTRRVFGTAIGIFTLGSLLCGLSTSIHLLILCRILQGAGGAMMVPVGRLTMVRTFARAELVRAMAFVAIPSLIAPLLGPLAGGLIVRFFNWRVIFLVNIPIGLAGLYLVRRHLPDFRAPHSERLDLVGFVLFGAGVALLSYVLEVFGEHFLGLHAIVALLAIAATLLLAYARHALRAAHPLLRLGLFHLRTFRVSVVGSFVTRLGLGGMPFLLPLLYQIGLGYTPVQSGLLILPQSLAAMSFRLAMPRILRRFGYRVVLLSNTLAIGGLIGLYAFIGLHTPVAVIVALAFAFGFFSSFQYTSMNTLAYADVSEPDTSMASTMASTSQQLSMSFGVATASLATAFFVPNRFDAGPHEIITGIHHACLALAALTILSTLVFASLHPDDGASVSQHPSSLADDHHTLVAHPE
ncbi:MAG TPA: DHA2 family efflux MFS transporter permease subunit [Polyangia bacterium]|nr:DHA2 family efflux MFS transporter permease subunit [Polyangia bacterium]